jgi:hypothetical protein
MSYNSSTLLVGGQLLSFGKGISNGLKDDILNCLQYVQLSASTRHDRNNVWKPWMDDYQQQLLQTGTRKTGTLAPARMNIKSVRDLKNLSLNVSGGAASHELKRLLDKSLDSLMDSDHAKTWFKSWFSSGRSQSFQVVPCESDGGNGARLLVCGTQITTYALDGQLPFYLRFNPLSLWYVLSGKMSVHALGAAFDFTAEGFEPHRDNVRRFLVEHAEREIVEL